MFLRKGMLFDRWNLGKYLDIHVSEHIITMVYPCLIANVLNLIVIQLHLNTSQF